MKELETAGRTTPALLKGHYLDKGVIYEATVKSETETKKYVGLTEGTFKRRLYGHRQSINNNSLKNSTELSKYIWHLKEKNEEYDLSWDIIDKTHPIQRIVKQMQPLYTREISHSHEKRPF